MEKILRTEVPYIGRSEVIVYKVELPDGSIANREVISRPNAVAILAVNNKKEIAMIKQYRIAVGRDTFEIPAGKVDPGENPRDAAIRELKEETGLIADKMEFRQRIYPSPGYSTEAIDIYFTDSFTQGEPSPDEGEFVTFEFMPENHLMRLISCGAVCDAKTIVSLLYMPEEEGND